MSIEAVLDRNINSLLALPNVVDVAITERDGREALLVFVSRKILPGDLNPHDRVPDIIDGYRTVVQVAPSVG